LADFFDPVISMQVLTVRGANAYLGLERIVHQPDHNVQDLA
jgi:hypothetical protein